MKWQYYVGLVLATLLALGLIYSKGRSDGRLEGQLALSQLTEQLATARSEAVEVALKNSQHLADTTKRLNDEHAQAMGKLQHNAAVSRDESDSLRGQLTDLRSRLRSTGSGDPTSGLQYATASKAAMVLSELYGVCVKERSDLAQYADESYERSTAVVKRFNQLRGQ